MYLNDVLIDAKAHENAIKAAKDCESDKPEPARLPADTFPLKSIQGRDGLTLSIYCFSKPAQSGDRDDLDHSKTKLIYTLNLEPRIRHGFLEQDGDFDDVLVADAKGRVVLQKSTSGPRIAELKSTLTNSDSGSPQNPRQLSEQPNQQSSGPEHQGVSQALRIERVEMGWPSEQDSNLKRLNDESAFTDVTLAGEPYKMFSQPVQISFHNEPQGTPPLKLIITGLRRSSNFISQTHALPYSTLIWAGLIVLALFTLSWPLCKLHYMSHTERFTPKDGWALVLTIFLATTSATLILLNSSYIKQAESEIDSHLKALAGKIQANFSNEMEQVGKQLLQLREAAAQHAKATTGPSLIANYLQQTPAASPPLVYPYFEIAFWTDCDGAQQVKFDVRRAPTSVVNTHDVAFFQSLKMQGGWKWEADSQDARKPRCHTIQEEALTQEKPLTNSKFVYFQAEKSPNTDEYSALVAIPFPFNTPGEPSDFAVGVMTIRPMSLMDPVLPPGYRFAVIDEGCNVLFHSDSFRDGKENFCDESEDSKELDPWRFSGTDSSLDISYSGHSERAYLTKLKLPGASSGRAFLIVFQSPDRQVTLNLAIILVCSILLAAYVTLPLVLAGLHLASRKQWNLFYAPQFIWPCREQAISYIQIAAANAGMLLMFWMVYLRLYEAPLLALTLAVSILSIAFALFKLYDLRNALAFSAVLLLAAGGLGLLLYLVWPKPLGPWCWLFVFLVFSAGIAYLLSGLARWAKPFASRFFTPRTKDSIKNKFAVLYVMATLSVIACTGVAPTQGFFKYAYDTASELVLKHDQVVLSHRVLERFRRIHVYYENVQSRPEDNIRDNRVKQSWDRYDKDKFDAIFTEMCEPAQSEQPCSGNRSPDPAGPPDFNERIEKIIAGATLRFPTNELGSEMSKLGVSSSNDRQSWEHYWNENADNPKEFTLVWKPDSRMPNFQVRSAYPRWRGLRLVAKVYLALL